MASSANYFLAARVCEIAELESLARTCELVTLIGRFTHALQRERGISNIFLASRGQRFGGQRLQQLAECEALERQVRAALDRPDTAQARNGARLFSRIALLLHALDGLPALRARIASHQITTHEATAALVQLIARLLAVVFEAADGAGDAEVSRALVALFSFLQAKEFAGQERAFGAAAFASGGIDEAGRQQWQALVDSQQACLRLFADCAAPSLRTAAQDSQAPRIVAELERLRRVGCAAPAAGDLDRQLSDAWYDCCTQRIDAMKGVEDLLTADLRRLCERRIAQAREELRDQQAIVQALAHASMQPAPAGWGPHLERAMLDLVQDQARRLQALRDELDAVRATLGEHKLVERAKGLLMAHRQMGEDEAYRVLRRTAMNQNRRLVDVAEAVLSTAEVLAGPVR